MKSKLFIIGIAVIVIIGSGYGYMKYRDSQRKKKEAAEKAADLKKYNEYFTRQYYFLTNLYLDEEVMINDCHANIHNSYFDKEKGVVVHKPNANTELVTCISSQYRQYLFSVGFIDSLKAFYKVYTPFAKKYKEDKALGDAVRGAYEFLKDSYPIDSVNSRPTLEIMLRNNIQVSNKMAGAVMAAGFDADSRKLINEGRAAVKRMYSNPKR